MWIYGDRACEAEVASELAAIARTGDFFHAAEVAQGLVDAEFEARGEDDLTPLHAAALEMVRSCLRGRPATAPLQALPLPARICRRTPEGHAFYAVYPQAYALAARRVAWEAPPFVIGLRSIGLGLACVVAEAVGAAGLVSLRPTGDPFDRRPKVSDSLARTLAAHRGPFAVVDEGPGLSGSSFGGTIDLLEDLGVETGRIVVLPSHAGAPGAEASPRHRARWPTLRREVATFDDLLAETPIARRFGDLLGEVRTVEDLSAGAWRAGAPLPAWRSGERRKFRLTAAGGTFVARFAGLGPLGEAKFALARELHAAGFAPEPIALRDGLMLERWIDAPPGPPTEARLQAYLTFRSHCPPPPTGGADGATLAAMALRNAELMGGPELRQALEPRLAGAGRLVLRPVWTDGRLQPWEWRGGLKTDGLDHACGHDLVGAQDIAWDVAGAASELDLTPVRTDALARAVGADPQTLALLQPCYDAFQAALWAVAAEDPEEGGWAARRRDRHLSRLRASARLLEPDL